MALSSADKRRQILRYCYALVGVFAASGLLAAIVLSTSYNEQRALRDRTNFSLRSAMLAAEAVHAGADLQAKIARREAATTQDRGELRTLGRQLDVALLSIEHKLAGIRRLHERHPQAAEDYAGALTRVRHRYQELVEAAGRHQRSSANLSERVSVFNLALFQLERLHAIGADELLEQMAGNRRRLARTSALALSLVLLGAGLLVARILYLLTARLREHERTERALIDNERRLRQTSKLEALGALAGGVAHDFNNVLTVILGNTECLWQEMRPGDPGRDTLLEIRKAGERAANLTRQMLTFSRRQPVELKAVDLNLLIRDLEPMLRRLFRADVELILRLDSSPCRVQVDPVQIEQVLINLAVNARDAMPDGGALTVQTSRVEIVADDSDHPELSGGSYVRILLEDTGCGIPPETLPRVFDPFFTTKEQGKGTGLGLSIVHGVVTKIGGQVRVHSEPGAGTRFEIHLRACEAPAARPTVDGEPQPETRGLETVLVAEDDPQIRRLMVEALRRAGYEVLEASDGREALRLCAEHREPLDLILSDMVMPGMHGPEMVERALELHPSARVLYVSGYADQAVVGGGGTLRGPLLPKPFKLQQLLAMVRQQLDAPCPEFTAAVDSG